MTDARTIKNVKIYGERNTGTTFLNELVKNNFAVANLRGTVGGDDRAGRKDIYERLADQPWLLKAVVIDHYNTIANRKMMATTLGWKHMSPPVEYLKTVPEMAAKTLFLAVVKHPVFWVQSFHRKPYHSYFSREDMTFSEFVRHVFIPAGRDNLDEAVLDSAVDLYAAKIDGYRALAELGVAFEIVRYEELLGDVPGFLKRIETKYNLARRAEGDVVREESTKKDDATLGDYQAKYRLDKVREGIAPEDYDFIMTKFGKDRLAWLGYPEG